MLLAKDHIFNNLQGNESWSLEAAQKRGDWNLTSALIEKGKEWILNEIKVSQFRGRGGLGNLVWKKWSLMGGPSEQPIYLVIDATESEPGTCKDREILRHEPHKLLEGCLLSGFAIGAHACYISIRGEYVQEAKILEAALHDAYSKKLLGKNAAGSGWDFDIHLHRGAGAYIMREETALLESLEGKKGFPRLKPPFPSEKGLYGSPTMTHNVETIAMISTLLRRGGDWFSSIGTAHSKGSKIFCLSGHINTPCIVEEALGVSLKELLETYAGGVRGGWDNLLAVIPGGVSTPLVPKEMCEELTMDFESLETVPSSLGTGGIIVIDKSTDIIKVITRLAKFYQQESCGCCTPCREGTGWVWRILERMIVGNAELEEIEKLEEITRSMATYSMCSFGEKAVLPVQGLIRHFRPELERRIQIYKRAGMRKAL